MIQKKVLIVANPLSGNGKSVSTAERFRSALEEAGYSVVVIASLGRELMLEQLCGEITVNRSSILGLISVGGDGLLHTLLPVIKEFDLPFTVVPAGTGNDFAREINAMKSSEKRIVELISHSPKSIDSVIIESEDGLHRACQVLSLGFDALVNERANGFKRVRGKLKYVVAIIRELPVFKPMFFSISIDGVDYSQEAMLIAVANGPSYGGGMKICPSARFDDGLLDVLILSKVSIPELIKVFPRVYSGSHVKHPAVSLVRGREISVQGSAKAYADGEYISTLPIRIHVEPLSLKVWR